MAATGDQGHPIAARCPCGKVWIKSQSEGENQRVCPNCGRCHDCNGGNEVVVPL